MEKVEVSQRMVDAALGEMSNLNQALTQRCVSLSIEVAKAHEEIQRLLALQNKDKDTGDTPGTPNTPDVSAAAPK